MSLQLHLFQHPEDGWSSVLEPWLDQAAHRVLRGEGVWLITPGRLAAHWIRQRWSSSGRPWFGIRTLEPWSLRRELAARLNHPYEPLGRESLELLLVMQARNNLAQDPLAPRVATSPGAALRALDELGRAGWLSQDKAIQETGLAPWLQVLENTDGWLPALDHKLLNSPRRENNPRLHLFFWGWDSQQQDHWLLLLAALRQATTATITSPAPRFEGRETEQPWLEFLSQHFQQPFHVCPAPSYRNPTPLNPFPLASASPAQAIEAILAALRDPIKKGQRTAIALEPTSALGPPLRTRLRQLGLPFYDDLGTPKPASPQGAVRRAWIDYHASEGSLAAFLLLWNELVHGLGPQQLTSTITLERILRRAFSTTQTTRLPLLLNHPSAEPLRKAIGTFLAHVEPWPDTLTWDQTVQRLIAFEQAIGADPCALQPLICRLKGLLGQGSLARTDLLRFLVTGLNEGGIFRHPEDNNPFAPLILTTRQNALDQSWEALVLTDANEGVWPRILSENPFLPDPLRIKLNAHRRTSVLSLLTLRDQAARERDQTARLIEASSTQVALNFLTRDAAEPQVARFPNELAARWSDQTAPQCRPLPPPYFPKLASAEREHITRVHASRRDPTQPFDEYFWNLGELSGKLPPWNPSSLDTLRSQPTAFFLKWFYSAEPTWCQPWKRQVNAAVGTLAHRWLAIACNGLESPDRPQLEGLLQQAYKSDSENAPNDPWWRGVFAQAWFYAHTMALAIPPLAKGYHLQTEFSVASDSVHATALALNGKVDLILKGPLNHTLRIVDFKTGSHSTPPSLAQLLKPNGSGLQLAAYLWLFSEENDEVEVGIVDRDGVWHPVLTQQNLSDLQPVLDFLAHVRKEGIFAPNPHFPNSYLQPEPMPFACSRLPLWLLKRKATAGPPAFSPNQDSSDEEPS